METFKQLFNTDSNKDDGDKITLIDGYLAIGCFIFYMILMFLFGLLMHKTDIYSNFNYFKNKNLYKFIFYIPITLISILPIIPILYLRKHSLASIGIKKGNILKSILVGVLFAIPLALPTIITGINNGRRIDNIENLTWNFLYFLICIGFVEELIFRGFIQTRLRGLIKNKWLSIVIVGVMFSSMHIPFQMLSSNISIFQFIQQNTIFLLRIVLYHFYFTYIYSRYNNIIAPTLTHTIMNFVSYIFI